MNSRWQDIGRWVATLGVAVATASCGAAADVGTADSPTTLALFDSSATTALESDDAGGDETGSDDTGNGDDTEAAANPTTTATTAFDGDGSSTTVDNATTTTLAPVTTQQGPVGPIADPFADYCAAAADVHALGALTEIDDPVVVETYFTSLSSAAAGVAAEAPDSLSADAQLVATYRSRFLDVLTDADFDLFAAFADLEALDAELEPGEATIRVDQFTFSNCDIEPSLPEQATAAFYISLLADDEGRTQLAELLAAAEVFELPGAQCFVAQASADAIHPLVAAPSTAAQDAALSQTLSACQLSLG